MTLSHPKGDAVVGELGLVLLGRAALGTGCVMPTAGCGIPVGIWDLRLQDTGTWDVGLCSARKTRWEMCDARTCMYGMLG